MIMFYWLLIPQLVALILVIGIAWFWKWSRARRQLRPPVKEKMLRPPGESLRRKLEDLNDGILETYFLILALGMMLGFIIQSGLGSSASGAMNKGAIGVVLVLGVLFLAAMGRKLWVLLQRRRDYDLGFKGERVVHRQGRGLVNAISRAIVTIRPPSGCGLCVSLGVA